MTDQAPAYNETPGFFDQITEWVDNIDNNNDMRVNQVPDENYTEALEGSSALSDALSDPETSPEHVSFLISSMEGEKDRSDLMVALAVRRPDMHKKVSQLMFPEASSPPVVRVPGLEWDASKLGSTISHNDETFEVIGGPDPITLRRKCDGKEVLAR